MPPDAGLEPLALFRTLAVHESLADRMRPLGAGILAHGLLDPRDRELMIHRTCARCGAEYEWGVHAAFFGPQVGLTDEQLAATVTAPAEAPVWTEREGAVIRLADELHDTGQASDATYAGLARHFSDAQILELAVASGWYHTVSFVLGVARVRLEPWAARFPSSSTPTTTEEHDVDIS